MATTTDRPGHDDAQQPAEADRAAATELPADRVVPRRKADALPFERKLSLVVAALMGVQEAASWLRDPELTGRLAGAGGRGLDLLRAVRNFIY